jgi:DNA polymerase-4
MEAYAEASARVFEVFRDISPNVEAMSIDEAFIDVTGLWRLVGPAEEIAANLKTRVRDEVGLPLSVGVASTKFLAKVASAVGKPDGLLVVEPGRELDFLHPLPVEALWGVGPKTAALLHQRGIRHVSDVAGLELNTVVAMVGKGAGNHLHALANNRDPRRVEPGRRNRSIGSQRSFPAGGVDRAGAEEILLAVCDGVTTRLRNSNQLGRTVTLRLRYGDFTSATRSHTVTEATDSTKLIHSIGHRLLDAVWPELERKGCTKVGIAVSNLCPADAVQLAIPFDRMEGGRPRRPDRQLDGDDDSRLDQAVDQARRRFGYRAVSRASLTGRAGSPGSAGGQGFPGHPQ